MATTPALLITARIFQAIGGAILTPTSLALVLSEFPKSKRATAVSIWGAVGALAAAVGPSLGSSIITLGGWRWVFLVNLPVGLAALYLSYRVLQESRGQNIRTLPDFLGSLLLILGVGLIALGLVQSEAWGWASSWTWGALLTGTLIFILFVLQSKSVASPALDLTLFADANYRYANLATFVFGIAFTVLFSALSSS